MAAQRKRPSTSSSTARSKRGAAAGTSSKTARRGVSLGAVGRTIGGRGPWYVKTLRWFAFLAVAGVLASALTFFILYRAISIPAENAAFQTQTTQVFYSDGKHKIGEFAQQDRESVSIDEIPASMQAAAIAAEDRSFYTNRGIDLKGIIRAARDNTTSGSVQAGGSTITQQYVKILYLTQERSYTRKVKEAILSIKIHNQLSKKQILEGYLNTIYFGNRSYGVQVASQTYFGKPASQLNYAQSALLATIVNSPSYYDPYAEGAQARIQPRFNYVLDGMVKSKAITAEEAAAFRDRIPEVKPLKDIDRFGGTKGYLLDAVKKEMAKLKFDQSQIDGGGLRIVTTFDYQDQKAAVAAVKAKRPQGAPELHPALVSVQPGTGAVRAMYGGPDYLKSEQNWAMLPTQPGSTFKVFAVVAALENGYSLKTTLNGNSPLLDDTTGKQIAENQGDSGGRSFGRIPLSMATQESVNTAFVDLVRQMDDGPAKVIEAAGQAGIPQSLLDQQKQAEKGSFPLVTPLGYFGVAPIDIANAYATLAADGKRADWYIIKKVSDYQGSVLHEHENKNKRTIPADVAADTLSAMQGVVRAGSGTNARTVCTTAGKTGTATAGPDNDQHVSSSWFAGVTPKLATAVMYNRGTGNEDLEGYMLPIFYGGQIPAMTFQTYMNDVLDPSDCGTFPPPANIKGDKGTDYVAPKPKPTKKPKPEKTRKTQEPKPTTPAPTTPPPVEPPPVEPPPASPSPSPSTGGPVIPPPAA
ncbi:MAG: transglycosylase domain-containing protein [Aeromicrobium sp.]